MLVRLQKYLSEAGICSRRKAEEVIKQGMVKVNDEIATLGQKIDPEKDEVICFGKPVKVASGKKYYVILNKPMDYICSNVDQQGRNVFELLTPKNFVGKLLPKLPRLVIVGRLDKDSSGLVILTNDGEFTNELTHPSFEHEKEYELTLGESFRFADKKIMEHGMVVKGEKYQGIEFTGISKNLVRIILREGKNRQIRKMFGALGYNLQDLKRIRIGKIQIGNLPKGKWDVINKI